MWPHKDFGWWGFVLSMVALLLIYPVGVIVNITTPKLQNWWATRSRASLQTRIKTLQEELARIERIPPVTFTEDYALLGTEQIGRLIQYSAQFLASVAVCLLGYLSSPGKRFYFTYGFIIFLAALNYLTYKFTMAPIRDYRHTFGPLKRTEIQLTIDKLTAKLSRFAA
jgi:hypothetical protein